MDPRTTRRLPRSINFDIDPAPMAIEHATAVTNLPRYRRTEAPFDELFGAPAAAVLASMDAAGDDVPSGSPEWAIDLETVGLRREAVPIAIRDPFGSGDVVQAICAVRIAAGVPAAYRGIHVSRIGQVIAQGTEETYRDVADYASAIARRVAACQYGRATIDIHARIAYLEEVRADRTGRVKPSLEHLQVIARETIHDGLTTTDTGLRITHLIACPCVQRTFAHAVHRAGDGGGPRPEAGAMLMTHSQRCVTTIVVRGATLPCSPIEMLADLDRVLVRTCNTLPRDAELACVYRAHRSPQFIEDALRGAVVAVARALPASSFEAVTGRARSLESIHEYDLTASLTLRSADVPRT